MLNILLFVENSYTCDLVGALAPSLKVVTDSWLT